MQKLAIIHYMPLEYYPPVTNLIDYIATEHSDKFRHLKIYSCHNIKKRIPYTISSSVKGNPKSVANIVRFPFPKDNESSPIRLFKYLYFNLFTIFSLILFKPDTILYYESFSVWPAWFYTKFINRNCRIFIHNHEYASPEWYQRSMRLVKQYHKLEKKWLYPKAVWISQTNDERNILFRRDHITVNKAVIKVLPNYPTKKWSKENNSIKTSIGTPIKCVYIGSISVKSTYIKEFIKWIINKNGVFTLDIFSYNLDNETMSFLKSINSDYINFYKDGIEYDSIPNILNAYHVGLILYKPYSENVINCVSNKFYEYYACGLDIWFSHVMISTRQHIQENFLPKIIPVDFENLDKFNWETAISREGLKEEKSAYYCEEVYKELVEAILTPLSNR